jgi:hypothetical protein
MAQRVGQGVGHLLGSGDTVAGRQRERERSGQIRGKRCLETLRGSA